MAAAHVRVLDITGLIVIYLSMVSMGLAEHEHGHADVCRRKIFIFTPTRKAHRFAKTYPPRPLHLGLSTLKP